MKIPIALGLALLLSLVPSAHAETFERAYEAVMHVRNAHAMPVLDSENHVVGTGAFKGLAIFADGEIAIHRYDGWFDLTAGSGKFHGYALWRFDDGSEIKAAYEGTVQDTATKGFIVEARIRDVSGTGRFAGASGEGVFQGRRLEPIDQGGTTHLTGILRLSLPD